MCLNLLVICAFANFLYVTNPNTDMSSSQHYVNKYFGNQYLDSFMQVYLIQLGKFDLDPRSAEKTNYIVFIMFTLGTFILTIVFMNMLIAIMQDTFEQVALQREETRLQEQA